MEGSGTSIMPIGESRLSPPQRLITLIELLGLCWPPAFYRDQIFLLALAAGPAFWILWASATPVDLASWVHLWSFSFLSLALWQPLVEELFFRGVVQGAFCTAGWRRNLGAGITTANLTTSMLFVAGHFLAHPPFWALSVLFPSLLFGLMRDRFYSTYPAIVLHVFYNGGYFLLTGIG